MALDTVQDYVDKCRTVLMDTVVPYRYSTASLVENLNDGILEMRRLRPDLLRAYVRTSLPEFSESALTDTVGIDHQYRMSLVYYICGHAQIRDTENTQDARATVFLNKFISQLLVIQA